MNMSEKWDIVVQEEPEDMEVTVTRWKVMCEGEEVVELVGEKFVNEYGDEVDYMSTGVQLCGWETPGKTLTIVGWNGAAETVDLDEIKNNPVDALAFLNTSTNQDGGDDGEELNWDENLSDNSGEVLNIDDLDDEDDF
eukprot:TRINITY_DN6884_c0_g1_i2.p2 TRINITY_DN6884_c0_g1~~TRINITY_DN6884_c0_g1_i2.p2  ORF type:complete len:138 (-),score=52.51 TRINITY_DN6884_c0_g1_i2:23-436(-)